MDVGQISKLLMSLHTTTTRPNLTVAPHHLHTQTQSNTYHFCHPHGLTWRYLLRPAASCGSASVGILIYDSSGKAANRNRLKHEKSARSDN